MSNTMLTIDQLANITGFTQKTIRCWCQRGDVFPTARKVPNIPKGQWRVLSDDVALIDMLDGHADNASLLANQNQRISELEAQALKSKAEYQKLMKIYSESLAESNHLDDVIRGLNAKIDDLSRYKEHYLEQQRRQKA